MQHATVENDGPAKRQRRPSVRLNQPYYVNPSQVNLQKKWDAFKKDLEGAKKARIKRNNNNNNNAVVERIDDFDFDEDDDDLAIGNWKNLKMKGKRKMGEEEEEKEQESLNSNGSESDEDQDFVIEKSNEFRMSLSRDDEDSGKKEMALANGNGGGGIRGSGGGGGATNGNRPKGVKMWLNELGLAKYESVFQVHEVDEQVLPLLTIEDLKDMGINAVGARRKMYCSIQKLGKGFA